MEIGNFLLPFFLSMKSGILPSVPADTGVLATRSWIEVGLQFPQIILHACAFKLEKMPLFVPGQKILKVLASDSEFYPNPTSLDDPVLSSSKHYHNSERA